MTARGRLFCLRATIVSTVARGNGHFANRSAQPRYDCLKPAVASSSRWADSPIGAPSTRSMVRLRSLTIERVDGAPIGESAHRELLATAGFKQSYRGWALRLAK